MASECNWTEARYIAQLNRKVHINQSDYISSELRNPLENSTLPAVSFPKGTAQQLIIIHTHLWVQVEFCWTGHRSQVVHLPVICNPQIPLHYRSLNLCMHESQHSHLTARERQFIWLICPNVHVVFVDVYNYRQFVFINSLYFQTYILLHNS